MARITIEDCLKYVPNSFELAVLAGYRVRALLSGSKPLVDRSDVETVTALREIAAGVIDIDELRRAIMTKQHGSVVTEAAKNDSSSFFSDSDLELRNTEGGDNKKEEGELAINFGVFSDQNLEVED